MSKTTPGITASLFMFSLILAGCQTLGTSSDVLELSYGMQMGKVSTDVHQHLIINHKLPEGSQSLHIYIEGDGRPWARRYLVSSDPTSGHALALALMRRDSQNDTLYLGRPCYFNDLRYGLSDDQCNPALWTSHRYSETVVASMVQALHKAVDVQAYQQVVLIGHSGGGTLAMLIAHRLTGNIGVITLGANLDVDAWTRHHFYTPLSGSLNPAKEMEHSTLPQIHLVGSKDKTTPPTLNEAFLARLGQKQQTIDQFDHFCCWQKTWPEILNSALEELQQQDPGRPNKKSTPKGRAF